MTAGATQDPQATIERPPTVDDENPWPALAAFEEADHRLFHGRDVAVSTLRAIVQREDRVLLYGSSGLGKTSLLRAGLFPALPSSIMPVYIRLHYEASAPDLREQVLDAVAIEAAARHVDVPPPAPSGTLWEYFRRRTANFWGAKNCLVVPLLVFDQFEEYFSAKVRDCMPAPAVNAFFRDLGDLVNGRAPDWLDTTAAPASLREYLFESPACKVLFSFREEFLADVKRLDWIVPSIDRNALRLEPMRWSDAARAIRRSGAKVLEPLPAGTAEHGADDVAAVIADVVSGATDPSAREQATIEPTILSVFCTELNAERKALTPQNGPPLISVPMVRSRDASQIIASFYHRSLERTPASVRQLIEDRLTLPSGGRDSVAWETVDEADRPAIEVLIDRWRILRRDPVGRQGQLRLELTHDVLVRPALADKAARQRERDFEQRTQRERDEQAKRERELRERTERERTERERVQTALEQKSREQQLLEQAKRLAEEQARLAEKAKILAEDRKTLAEKTAYRTRLLLLAVGVLCLGIIVAAGYAWRQARDAESRALDYEISQAIEPATSERPRLALSQLAALLRRHPKNDRLRAVTLDVLMRTSWWVPIAAVPGTSNAIPSALSPSGELVVTQSSDDVVQVWRARTGDVIQRLPHTAKVDSFSFSPDSSRVMTTAGSDLHLWRAEGGGKILSFPREGGARAEFSPDGKLIVVVGTASPVTIYSVASAKLLSRLPESAAVAHASSDSSMVALLSVDRRSVRLFDTTTGKPSATALRADTRIDAFALSASGDSIAITEGGGLRVWSMRPSGAKPVLIATLRETEPIRGIRFDATGVHLLSQTSSAVRVWKLGPLRQPADATTAHEVPSVTLRHPRNVRSAAFETDGNTVVTEAEDGVVRRFDAASGRQRDSFASSIPVVAVDADAQTQHIVTTGGDGTSAVWARVSGPATMPTFDPFAVPAATAVTPSGRSIATVSRDGQVDIWDVGTGTGATVREPTHVSGPVGSRWSAEFASDDRLLIIEGPSASVFERNNAGWGERVIGRQPADISAARFDGSGMRIVTGASNGEVRIWHVGGAQVPTTFPSHKGPVTWVEFSADGRRVLSAAADGTVHVSDAVSGRRIGEAWQAGDMTGAAEDPVLAAFSRDGGRVVTVANGTARVWTLGQPAAIHHFPGVADLVSIRFTADDDVLTASKDGTLWLWDARTWKPRTRQPAHNGLRAATVSANGLRLITAGSDNKMRVWSTATLDPEGSPVEVEGSARALSVNHTGTRAAILVEDARTVKAIDLPAGAAADAEWLAEFAGAIAGGPSSDATVSSPLPAWVAAVKAWRTTSRAPADSLRRNFVEWFFAPPDKRSPSPFTSR